MPFLREDTHLITVMVDGVPTTAGAWATLAGGEVDSEETKIRPGGMAPAQAIGGPATPGNVTVGRPYDPGRDDVHALAAKAGNAYTVVSAQPLDSNRNAFGRPRVYTGILKAVTPPDADAGGSDEAVLELEVSVGGELG